MTESRTEKKPIKVLLLDDRQDNLILRSAILRSHGYVAVSSASVAAICWNQFFSAGSSLRRCCAYSGSVKLPIGATPSSVFIVAPRTAFVAATKPC